jgi:hypothetical protein
MTPGRADVEFMRAIDPIRQAIPHMSKQLLLILTLIHKQILNCKLFILIPPQPQATPTVSYLRVETPRIEQVKYLLGVDLQI